jgi:hypothetical protein
MTEHAVLTPNSVIAQGEGQVSTVVDGQAVLMSVDNGMYYSMDDIGTQIWALIERPTSVRAICDRLVSEYQVERATCEADVLDLLEGLLKNDLVRVVSEA